TSLAMIDSFFQKRFHGKESIRYNPRMGCRLRTAQNPRRGFTTMESMLRHLACGLSAAILGGCHPSAPPPDPYDQGKMDFKSTPAKVFVAARHNGALAEAGFAEGASLSLTAELKPLDPSPVKSVRLDTTHKIIEIAPGVKFSAWTFGDQVPGPTVRARVG